MMSEKCGIICSVYCCKNYSWQKDARSFFRFPRNRERCAVWVSKCKREDLDQIFKIQSAEYLNKNNRICSDHFQLSDFNNPNLKSQGLKKTAIPSLNLTEPSSENLGRNTLKNQQELPKRRVRLCVREIADSSMSDKKGDSPLSSALPVNSLLPEFLMESQNSSVRCIKDAEMDSKTVIKEEPRLLQEELAEIKSELNGSPFVDVKNEIVPFESHFIAENVIHNDHPEAVIKGEIKEEPSWMESGFTEPKLESEEAPSSAGDQNEEKDSTSWMFGMYEDISQPESPRLCTEAMFNQGTGVTGLFPTSACENSPNCEISSANDDCITDMHGSEEHISSHDSNKSHKCIVCERRFASAKYLNTHIMIHEGKRAYNCDICKKSFTRTSTLRRHNFVHEGNWPFKCEVCGKGATHQSDLRRHSAIHEGKKPFKCGICEKSYTRMSALNIHNLIHEGKKSHKCEICKKTFYQLSNLRVHSVIHEDERPYKCELCDKTFRRMRDLKAHNLTHEGKKPYKCEICEKSFAHMSTLKVHKLCHLDERPYKCEVCNKSFNRRTCLKLHMLNHEGKRPFKGKLCEKSFSQVSNLKAHNLIHEGRKPHKCDICEKSFYQLSKLKAHFVIHGGIRS